MKQLSLNFAMLALLTSVGVTACQKPAEPKTDAKADTKTETTSSATPATTTVSDNVATTSGDGQITIGTESTYKPLSFKDAQGNLVGFEIDLANALCAEAKLKCTITSTEWDGLIPGLQSKKYHAIMAGMSDTPERRKVITFSEPYLMNQLVVIGKKDGTKDFGDLSGKNVAVHKSSTSSEYLEKHFPKAVPKGYDSQENTYLDLEAGRSEYLISDSIPALYWLQSEKGKNFEVKGQPINIDDKIAIGLRQNDPLIGKFNTALATLRANGTYEKINQKYFGAKQ